jgi:WD40 repeat protein
VLSLVLFAQAYAGKRQDSPAPASARQPPAAPRLVTDIGIPDGTTFILDREPEFSADGALLITHENRVRLWDAATGGELRSFAVPEGFAYCGMSADKKYLLEVGDRSFLLLDTRTGETVESAEVPESWKLENGLFCADGKSVLVAVSEGDTQFVVRQAIGASERLVMREYAHVVRASIDPRYVLLRAAGTGDLVSWDSQESKEVGRNSAGAHEPHEILALAPDGRSVLVTSTAGLARLDLVPGAPERILMRGEYWGAASFSADGARIAVGSSDPGDGTVRIVESTSGRVLHRSRGIEAYTHGVAFAPNGRYVAACFRGLTFLYDGGSGELIRQVGRVTGYGQPVAVSPDGRRMLDMSGNVVVWDLAGGGAPERLALPTATPRFGGVGAVTDRMVAFAFDLDGPRPRYGVALQDLETAEARKILPTGLKQPVWIALSPDSRIVAFCDEDTVQVWDAAGGRRLLIVSGTDADLSADGTRLAVGSAGELALYSLVSPLRRERVVRCPATRVAFSDDDRSVIAGGDASISVRDCDTGRERRAIALGVGEELNFVSESGRTVVLTSETRDTVRDVATGALLGEFARRSVGPISYDDRVVAVGRKGGFYFQDLKTGQPGPFVDLADDLAPFFSPAPDDEPGFWDWVSLTFLPGNEWVAVGGVSPLQFVDVATGRKACQAFMRNDGGWAVVEPGGRFDTDDLDAPKGLFWVLPDDPFTPLPIETFMRQYYEPRLLARILGREQLAPVPDLSSLNRVLPAVRIVDVRPEPGSPDAVSIRVDVASERREFGQGESLTARHSGVHDVRLFRDGKLVDTWPRLDASRAAAGATGDELATWREETRVTVDASGRATLTFSGVRLPRGDGTREVELAAYAFNEDRVKGTTDRTTFTVRAAGRAAAGRAFVVAFGCSRFENASWDLQYAANDARLAGSVLEKRLRALGKFASVVPIFLVSADDRLEGEAAATKANLKAVLDALAGRSEDRTPLDAIPGAGRLAKATPDDLVLLLCSTHGYVDPRGVFYTLPHDTGPGASRLFTEELLERCISSEEISLWMRDVDAGQIALVMDTCQSAGAVEAPGFKPGPMGSRSLGQMAYDKGMLILAASQALDVALELESLHHGLLSYALIKDGLEAGRADWKPKDRAITLAEWLAYAAWRAPQIQGEVADGTFLSRGVRVIGRTESKKGYYQKPALFDFARKRDRDPLLAWPTDPRGVAPRLRPARRRAGR